MNGWDIFWEVEACLDAPHVKQVVADWGGEYVPISLPTHKENHLPRYNMQDLCVTSYEDISHYSICNR